ncbi:cytochrome P450 [Ciceribacter sp. RN22]|uniref:cytochrome P450 n=1 Tax=Ciceribacter sp. RN22 TaxID=2954932 RepID=UPI0020929AD7|nr:cytochrome P450 [Ciceribacter sp. RN22]MCO6181135.1 cytochrome P450 [Ciceribacter sp. RN22]
MTTASLIRLASLDQLHGDGPHTLSVNGFDVVVVRTQAGFRAFQGRCPHQGALLGEGEITAGRLVCRNHGWRFSTESGEREGGPQCLTSYPIVEKDRDLYIEALGLFGARHRVDAVRTLKSLPGPRGLPVLGNAHELDASTLHLTLERWADKYGPAYLFRIGPKPVIVLSDPKWCEQVLRARPERFTRASQMAPIFSELGAEGVLTAEGEAWRTQRKLAVRALAPTNFRELYPKLQTVITRLKKRWERAADLGSIVDIVEDLKRFTLDVTTLITFGHDINTIEDAEDVIQHKLALMFPALNRRIFALFPTWRFVRLPQDCRLDRAIAELRAWLGELVVAERSRLAAEPRRAERPSNFLEAMVSARDEEGRPFADEIIFGNLMTMLLVGEDTSAHTLGWAVHQLCDSPDSVSQLRREADRLLGVSDVAGDIDTANKFIWAGAIVNETMRLRPVVPFQFLEAKVDTVVGDLFVAAGTRLAVLMRPGTRDSRHFADPLSFRPARWLDDTLGVHDASVHTPFGSGARICPGRHLALLEMKLVLAMLYKSFEVERVSKAEEVREQFAIAMSLAGLKVRLRPRSNTSAKTADS